MKLRMTKGRIACAVVLLPAFYVLNVGPLLYCHKHFGLSLRIIKVLYDPVADFMEQMPFNGLYSRYMQWWSELPPGIQDDR